MAFTPYLFIGIGETGAFFTLRETYEHKIYTRGGGDMGGAVLNGVYQGSVQVEIRSMHHFNLSQDADEAFRKAQEFAEANAMELRTSREELDEEMRKIQRATAEQRAERERMQRQREEQWEAERAAALQAKMDTIAEGKFPVGPYQGKEFAEADRGYLDWLMRTLESFEEGSLMRAIAEAVTATCAAMRLPVPDASKLVGEPKKRMQFDVTVVRSAYFDRESWNGWGYERVYVTTMVDADGACLVCFSSSFSPEVGEELTIKATVKEHSEYQGQAQTIVQRVAVQKEAA